MGYMSTIFCCFCRKASKDHQKIDAILEKGDEKMEKYINAEFIFETLKEHQRILKQLKPDEVLDKLYDDVIDMNDGDPGKPIANPQLLG